MRTSKMLVVSGAVLASLLVAACGSDEDATSEDATSEVVAADLEGRTFATSALGATATVDGTEVVIEFDGDRIVATGSCNTQSGAWSIADGRLVAGPLISTMMACEQALMDQDQQVAALLSAEPTISLSDDVLTLTDTTAAESEPVVFQQR